ncbi:PTS sugar transporter subunit IIA [Terribacillus sp. AE2B 122]|uniref:PTS sugar transporter subunit IIA n=1 Tax=Terribacillus sp. AE2B 122 TaxID=1331902 RepID=UPI001440C381|nr:PTS sugar transporter subunit IIA [Terribacillus sp. AE2B 122]VVM34439.1 PTS system2C galactitol-specific IIA component (EC 2.7.1.69) [Terribacillus sp. AE2B 122]
MNEADLLHEELVFLDVDARNAEDLFLFIGKELEKRGYVKSTFTRAITEREARYPTGLALERINIGIPHTDPIHVNTGFVAVVKNKYKIPFIHMGTDNQQILIDYFFVLGIKNPEDQVKLLQLLMEMFSSFEFIQGLQSSQEQRSLFSFIKNKFEE